MSAPVTFVTGLPGNGKTLYTICMVKEWAEKENRQVYYSGIEILDKQALPWQEFEPEQWHTLPDGALILVDEAHKLFPLRPQGSKVPAHVEPIAELRHKGHNLVLITQHPMEIDAAVRRRGGRHLHCVRRFGLQACSIREWPRVVENCDKTTKDAIVHEWIYKKEAYGWYKSAEIHTIKRRLPLKLLWLVAMVIMIPFAIWYMVHFFQEQRSGQAIKDAAERAGGPAVAAAPATGGVGREGRALTPQQYVDAYQPRVPGLSYTAPAYDKVTQPVRAPYPAACVESKTRCNCYSQQATRLDMPEAMCKQIAHGGFFMAWDERTQQMQPQANPAPTDQKLAGGNVDGLINLTPSSKAVAPATSASDAETGQGLANAKRKVGA
jgi:zona occludens toxin